jgi:general secretion pathway protein G
MNAQIHVIMAYQAVTQHHRKLGLTLVEILIVISIISIIAGVLMPNLNDVRKSSRDKKRKADLKAISEALELYKLNQDLPTYPSTEEMEALTPGEEWIVEGETEEDEDITYMSQFPKDPRYDNNPTKYFYRYYLVSSDQYFLGACLEDTNDPEVSATPPVGSFSGCDYWYYRKEP